MEADLSDDRPRTEAQRQSPGPPTADLRSFRLFRHELELVRHSGEIGQGRRLHFSHHLAAMDLHRDLADAEVAGNLLVEAAPRDLDQDFALTQGQAVEPFPKRGQGPLLLAPGAVPRKAEL